VLDCDEGNGIGVTCFQEEALIAELVPMLGVNRVMDGG
jgi:hypothetical protein